MCGGGGLQVSSTYEACSTQGFRAGRTEVIRAVTPQSKALVEAMLRSTNNGGGGGGGPSGGNSGSGGDGDDDIGALLRAAFDAQRETVRACQRGHGHERHLLGLLVHAQQRSACSTLPLASIFTDPGWSAVTTSVVSTSGLRHPGMAMFVFGPVTADGVGLGYLTRDDGIALTVSSFRSTGPDANALADAIADAAAALCRAVETHLPPPPPRSKL